MAVPHHLLFNVRGCKARRKPRGVHGCCKSLLFLLGCASYLCCHHLCKTHGLCVSSPRILLDICLPVLTYTEIYSRYLEAGGLCSKSAGLVRTALSGSGFGCLCCPALDYNTKSDSSSPDLLRDLPKILAEVMASPWCWWKGHWEVLSPPSPWSHHQH